MSCFKKRSALAVLSALMLVSSTPTKSEPATIVVGGVCLAGGALIGYLCSGSKEKLPSSELAVTQAANLRQKATGKHHHIIQASMQRTEDGFRQALSNRFVNTHEINRQVSDITTSLDSFDKKIEQLQKVKSQNKKLTIGQLMQMEKEEDALKKSRQKLVCALHRFNDNKSYFNLYARLQELQKTKIFSEGMYPTLDKIKNIDDRCSQLTNIAQDAERLGYKDLFDFANKSVLGKMYEHSCLREQPSFLIEKQAQLQHSSKMKCQKLYNAELERQADKDRQVRRQEIAAEKYRNMLRQQELDLAEGRVEQRIADRWRSVLAQEKNKLRQSQDSLNQTQRTLDKSLARERGLKHQLSSKESEKIGLVSRISALQKQLKKSQAREREKSKNNFEGQEGLQQCNQEGCVLEGCTGYCPSAPPQAKFGATQR